MSGTLHSVKKNKGYEELDIMQKHHGHILV